MSTTEPAAVFTAETVRPSGKITLKRSAWAALPSPIMILVDWPAPRPWFVTIWRVNPYNYDGVGYDGAPAHPSDRAVAYSIAQDAWTDLGAIPASMDHRGLLVGGQGYYILGGMGEHGEVLDRVARLPLRVP